MKERNQKDGKKQKFRRKQQGRKETKTNETTK